MSLHCPVATTPQTPLYNHPDAPDDARRQQARTLLHDALIRQLNDQQAHWLSQQLEQLKQHAPALSSLCSAYAKDSQLLMDMAFGLCPRRVDQSLLQLTAEEQSLLRRLLPGWSLKKLRCDDTARLLILTCEHSADFAAAQITHLLRHADLREQLAIYQGLPLLVPGPTLNDRLADGLRSNMNAVFEAIAHDNPYPAWYLDTHRFNHMVLKALFIESALEPVVGLKQRNNAELARMLLDTARERRAASRPVNPILYHIASPYMSSAERQEFQPEPTL